MSQQATLEELEALRVALDQTYEGLRSITMLGKNQGLFRNVAYLNLMNEHFAKVIESVKMSQELVKLEIKNHEKTKNMNDREKVAFYALSALADMQLELNSHYRTREIFPAVER